MALEVETLKDQEAKVATHTVTERLYKTADGEIVKDGDSRAAFLYATEGQEIPIEEARECGLVGEEVKVEPEPDKKPEPDKAEAKQAKRFADKLRKPAKNKAE